MKYIDADRLKPEIGNRYENMLNRAKLDPENANYWNGKADAYRAIYDRIVSLQQEQPEMDLEKFTEKIKTFQGRYKHPEIVSIKGAMAFMARMFYQYSNVARRWYESLPKATMD